MAPISASFAAAPSTGPARSAPTRLRSIMASSGVETAFVHGVDEFLQSRESGRRGGHGLSDVLASRITASRKRVRESAARPESLLWVVVGCKESVISRFSHVLAPRRRQAGTRPESVQEGSYSQRCPPTAPHSRPLRAPTGPGCPDDSELPPRRRRNGCSRATHREGTHSQA